MIAFRLFAGGKCDRTAAVGNLHIVQCTAAVRASTLPRHRTKKLILTCGSTPWRFDSTLCVSRSFASHCSSIGFRPVNEQHLVQSVIQRHTIRPDGLKAADRHRVCHHTVDEIVLHLRFRAVHADVVGFDVVSALMPSMIYAARPKCSWSAAVTHRDLSKRTERPI